MGNIKKEKVTYKDLKSYYLEDFPLWEDTKECSKDLKDYIEKWSKAIINDPIQITKKLKDQLTKDPEIIQKWKEL